MLEDTVISYEPAMRNRITREYLKEIEPHIRAKLLLLALTVEPRKRVAMLPSFFRSQVELESEPVRRREFFDLPMGTPQEIQHAWQLVCLSLPPGAKKCLATMQQ